MRGKRLIILHVPALAIGFFLSGCSVYNSSFSHGKKYAAETLQKDYTLFRNIMEESHPGLYWYTSRDSMDLYFDRGYAALKDSMSETDFRKVLNYVIARVNCGHTATRPSRQYSRYLDTARRKTFPLSIKIWHEAAVVATNLHRRDSILTRGAVIKSINGIPVQRIADSLFKYISSDGYNINHKYQTLSNRGNFGSLYGSVYGLKNNFLIRFIDSSGNDRTVVLPVYDPAKDSLLRRAARRGPRIPRRETRERIRQFTRSLRLDTANSTAFLDLNSFSKGSKLKSFFKTSFRTLNQNNISYLVIDLRSNGGGNVTNSTALTKFIARKKFKLADSLYAINRNSRYKKHIKQYFFNRLFMLFTTRRRNGRYHFGYFERHYYRPRKKNHFDGTVLVLTGGNSFSATTLFTQTVKDLDNVIVLGEETGGAAYGNTAWLIPDVVLPGTKVQFRLPLFRLVIDNEIPKDGHGIMPEIEVLPSVDAIRRGADYKMDKAMELIKKLSAPKK